MMNRLLAGGIAAGVVLGLAWLYGAAKYDAGVLAERGKWERSTVEATVAAATGQLVFERELGRARLAGELRVRQAAERHADELGALAAAALKSEKETEAYANTSDGRERCLAPERVRSIADADAAAAAVAAAGAPAAAGAAGGAGRALPAAAAGPRG